MFVGIDVGKEHVDVAIRPTGEKRRFRREEDLEELVAFLVERGPTLVVMEATGGLEMIVATAIAAAKLSVAIVNPRQVRDFAKAMGKLAKTDAVDAMVIATYGEKMEPKPRALPDAETQELQAVMARRRQLVEMKTAETNRLKASRLESMKQNIRVHIEWLEKQLSNLDKDIEKRIHESPMWHEKAKRLMTVPGVGRVISSMLLANLPELGTLDRRSVAALTGLAPLNNDSGKMKGKRVTWGGRGDVRTALYLGCLSGSKRNPLIKAFFDRLVEAGKPKKLALVACARKLLIILNAMVRSGQSWRSPTILPA